MHPQVRAIVKDLQEDRTHGASHLGRRAAAAFVFLSRRGQAEPERFRQELAELARAVLAAQPGVAPLVHLCGWLMERTEGEKGPREALRRAIVDHGNWVAGQTARVLDRAHGLLEGRQTLAVFGASSTVAACLPGLRDLRQLLWVGPGAEVPATLGRLPAEVDIIPRGRPTGAEALLVGADALTWQGVINVAGTRMAVEEAHGQGVSAYAVCDESKLLPRAVPPSLPPDEGLFDLTPLESFEGIVLGRGVLDAGRVRDVLDGLPAQPALAGILSHPEAP